MDSLDSARTELAADGEPYVAEGVSKSAAPRRRRNWVLRALFWLGFVLTLALAGALLYEMRTAELQSRYISRYAASLTYSVQPGPSPAILFPSDGPADQRLGYAYLPSFLEHLSRNEFRIQQQARFSPALLDYTQRGYFPPFAEKARAGLAIDDCSGEPLYRFTYPRRGYAEFASIPPLVVQSLLFVENRDLLDPTQRLANPAVDWPRLARAIGSQVEKWLRPGESSVGGSTLATQMEKYRHSPDGLTSSKLEKWRQMASASVRAYSRGPETLAARRDVVRDYLNTVPLSAVPGHGEVLGLADGLGVWFGADFDEVNRLLATPAPDPAEQAARGRALRQVVALMIAQRRPSYYLAQGHEDLDQLADSYLRLLYRGGIIDAELRDAALAHRLQFRDWSAQPVVEPVASNKGVDLVRRRLGMMLNLPLYSVDRLDLHVDTPLDGKLQEQVTAYLRSLNDPEQAQRIGLLGENLLSAEKVGDVRYTFTLFERDGDRFSVRVQTDSTNQPFDLNEASKLELGSTAKLRVLTTYLEIIAELHQRFADQPESKLRTIATEPADVLTRWALDYLIHHPERSLSAMLEAALERRYSANPGERFFTGGGAHRFGNFRREDNGRVPTLRESLRESINLPFVRLLRDIVNYSIYQGTPDRAKLLADDKDPRRHEYLSRFADREGRTFMLRFWRKYAGKSNEERLAAFLSGMQMRAPRLAAVHRYLYPDADLASFGAFLRQHLEDPQLSDKDIEALYTRYGPGKFNLPDQAYIARVHPLDLWLLGYLIRDPQRGFNDAVAASHDVRQEVYGWLFRSRHKRARDSRIGIMLEVEAFLDIHQRWQRLGYPFDHLVPSLATALGSSGDRPAALAELMGVILNDGRRVSTVRIDQLRFGAQTPYETALAREVRGSQVLPPEVAIALRGVLSQVVDGGTARRLQGSFKRSDGSPLVLGGKTGTGDNRIERFAGGGKLDSRVMNRTATFVFFLGERHFGVLTAFVPGSAASGFRFTSALPVQALRGMQPILMPHIEGGCPLRNATVPAPTTLQATSAGG